MTHEDVALVYTGDLLVSTGSTSVSSSKTVQLSAGVSEASDGSLGSQLGTASVVFTVKDINGATKATCTSKVSVPGTYTGTGTAGCSVVLGEGNYTVTMALQTPNGYYTGSFETAAVTVVLSGTGFTTGGGWLREPTLQTRSNLGFPVKFLKNGGVQGNSLCT